MVFGRILESAGAYLFSERALALIYRQNERVQAYIIQYFDPDFGDIHNLSSSE